MSSAHYYTQLRRWHANDSAFAQWQHTYISATADGSLTLTANAPEQTDPHPRESLDGRNYYNGAIYTHGQTISPPIPLDPRIIEIVPSWQAQTPNGTWIELEIRTNSAAGPGPWQSFGVWASGNTCVERHSSPNQSDPISEVSIDTFELNQAVESVQLRLQLFSAEPNVSPRVYAISLVLSSQRQTPGQLEPGDPALWGKTLAVPQCSQMVYPDGGNVWCSPTSVAMVLGYWQGHDTCAQRVHSAVSGVYDWHYDGHGNWPFNTAYAASQGFEAYVTRFTSMRQLEPWIAADVPLVISYAWPENGLTGAPIPSSKGHLVVLVGFDAQGNPIINDPAAPSNEEVQRTYQRSQVEPLWLKHSGGMAYIIYPSNHQVPALTQVG